MMSAEPQLMPSRSLPMADERTVTQRRRADRAVIERIEPGSAAAQAGLSVGDVLLSLNGTPALDIVDYHFYTAGEHVIIEVEREGNPMSFSLAKEYDENLGIEFADDLFDRVHICKNKCVFCFLYQQPKGLRPSLYIKDDDYRLSFLHGNYLTLTNMSEESFQRVIDQKLSPLFVSVHVTEPEVRGQMLGRKGPEPILPRLRMLANSKIQIHGQIVLCPGYNDGDLLERSIHELAELHPARLGQFGGVLSVAVVPVGLTQFRDRLAALTTVTKEYSKELLERAQVWRSNFREELGTNFLFLSDEFYLNAGIPLPSARQYEGFPQLEDGVGLVRQFMDDHASLKRRLPQSVASPRSATLVTGEIAEPLVSTLAQSLNSVRGLSVNVASVYNDFFKGNISVAGLLTGKDIVTHLISMGASLGDKVVLPSIMLRDPDRDIFLDDMTLQNFQASIQREVHVVDRMPSAAAKAILA
jgi:putative radical SAM enzyme (TIGR03279 family)